MSEQRTALPHLLRRYGALGKRAWQLMAGDSYWHVPQGLGRVFIPGKLEGYYNDLTGKVNWSGPVTEQGIPLNVTRDGGHFVFATTAIQKALGHWDLWLLGNRQEAHHLETVLHTAEWLVQAQDARGGWALWEPLGLQFDSPYSAMTQGEGVSVLVRAYTIRPNEAFRQAALRALGPLLQAVSEGGTAWTDADALILDEAPLLVRRNIVLNGWISGLYGLYDLACAGESAIVTAPLDRTVTTLAAWMPRFSAGYWSYYDEVGNIASPFYHALHIAQLRALALSFPNHATTFNEWASRFEEQEASRFRRLRAIAAKSVQKLKNPPQIILE